jgi:solute carrier family 10 (sodium/bile acid cotransporter), member 7
MAWLARNWFLLGMAAAVALATAFPELGVRGGPLRPEITTRLAIACIFFLQGLSLSPAALRAGVLSWRVHTAVQLFIFVGMPAAMLLFDAVAGGLLHPDVRLGFLFLAVLPTTISTCVVFTATAGGNTAAALFNAAGSNVAGVVITPLWAALLLSARGEALPVGPMMQEIALLLLVPLAVGQLARPLLLGSRQLNRQAVGAASSSIILYILFVAFAGSVGSHAFADSGLGVLVPVTAIAAGYFALATAAAASTGRRLGFAAADRTVLLFCAPQKTLAAGVPMAQILFAGHAGLALILLPLIAYHLTQLLVGATIADRLRRTAAAPRASRRVTVERHAR